jgi:drug/metabolite transporter (DMT)-like permease
MIAGALLFGLIAMFGYGLANTYSLPLAKRLNPARFLFLRGLATCAVVAAAAIPTLYRLADWRAGLAAFAIGVLGYLPPLAFTHGIKVSRIGIVAPIAGTAPLLTVLLSALVLHTHLQSIQWLGVAVIVLANIAVSVNFRSLRDSNILRLASGVPFALITAVLWGVVFFLIIYPTRSLGPWVAALMMELGVTMAAGVHVLLKREPLLLKESVKPRLVANAALIALGTLCYTIGIKSFNIGLVAILANSNAVVSIIAASFVHHERLTRSEKILATLLVAGVVLVSIA